MALSICPVCVATFPDARARNAHLDSEHPGTSLTWAGNTATITSPDGATRTLTRRDFRTLHERARAGSPAPSGDPAPSPDPEPTPAPRVAQRQPATPPATAPTVVQSVGRRAVSRAAVSEALTVEQLADLMRQVSVTLSEADGAGPAGEFTRSEAALLASLLYDQTIDVILRRFDGDVTRFRAAAALIIIAAGKGRVHLAALQRNGLRAPGGRQIPPRNVESSLPTPSPEPDANAILRATVAALPTKTVPPPWTKAAAAPATVEPEMPTPAAEPESSPEVSGSGGQILSRPSLVESVFGA